MQTKDYEEFRGLMSGIYDFYGKNITDFAMSLWWEAMRSYDLITARDALSRHMTNPDTGQFIPKPADVIKMIAGTTTDSAMIAWTKVDKAVRQIGPYKSVVFDDPIIHRVLYDMGGWIALGNKTLEEWPFIQREFENRYKGYRLQGNISDYPRMLTGMFDAENQSNGQDLKDNFVFIGNKEKAQNVLMSGKEKQLLEYSKS